MSLPTIFPQSTASTLMPTPTASRLCAVCFKRRGRDQRAGEYSRDKSALQRRGWNLWCEPNVNWAYNGSTGGGKILTSPVLSLDGAKIAYVESAGASAIFHVLTLGSSAGTVTKAAAPIASGSCLATSSCLKSVTFSSTATATLASPWVDYQTDKAFVGTDDGKIYKISCVFKCALNSQPTVLWTFNLPVAGTGGAAATPNGSVYDFPSGHLFVGDQLGELWVINAKSAATPTLAAGPVMIGGGGCTAAHPPGRTGTGTDCNASGGSFGIPDSILFDSNSISGRVYAFSGNDGTAGASAVVAQLASDLTGLVRVHVGRGSVGNITTDVDIHSGDFDNKYFDTTPLAAISTSAAQRLARPALLSTGLDSLLTPPWTQLPPALPLAIQRPEIHVLR